MGIREWFGTIFATDRQQVQGSLAIDLSDPFCRKTAAFYIKQLAIQTAINIIAGTLAQADFVTYQDGKRVCKDNYYLLNVEPNCNESATGFWGRLIHTLVYDNEVLVVMENNQLFLADSFIREVNTPRENRYKGVRINFSNPRTYKESDVLYLSLNSAAMRNLIEGLYKEYGELLEYSKTNYKRSNARRGVLEVPASYAQSPKKQEELQELFNKNFKDFFEAETGAVLPLSSGLTYTDLTNDTYKNGSDSRDIRELIDDIFDFVALAFRISPQLLKGSVADSDKSVDNMLMLCINPIKGLLEDEINRKMFGKPQYLKRTYIKIDTSAIRVTDIKQVATAIDILTRNGVNTLNDNLRLLGREAEADDVGDQRFLTLNLAPIEAAVEGGEAYESTGNAPAPANQTALRS